LNWCEPDDEQTFGCRGAIGVCFGRVGGLCLARRGIVDVAYGFYIEGFYYILAHDVQLKENIQSWSETKIKTT
jgi:hypothetical protein